MNYGLSIHLVWGWGLRDRSLWYIEFEGSITSGPGETSSTANGCHCSLVPGRKKLLWEGVKLKNRCYICVWGSFDILLKARSLITILNNFVISCKFPFMQEQHYHLHQPLSSSNITLCDESPFTQQHHKHQRQHHDCHHFDLWHIHQSVWSVASRVGSQAASLDVGQRVVAWQEEDGQHGQSCDKSEAVTITVMYLYSWDNKLLILLEQVQHHHLLEKEIIIILHSVEFTCEGTWLPTVPRDGRSVDQVSPWY